MGSLGNPAGCKPEVLRDMLGAIPRLATNMRINKCNVKVGTCWLVESSSRSLEFVFRTTSKLHQGWEYGMWIAKVGTPVKLVEVGPTYTAYLTSSITINKSDKLTCISKAKFKMLWDLADHDED